MESECSLQMKRVLVEDTQINYWPTSVKWRKKRSWNVKEFPRLSTVMSLWLITAGHLWSLHLCTVMNLFSTSNTHSPLFIYDAAEWRFSLGLTLHWFSLRQLVLLQSLHLQLCHQSFPPFSLSLDSFSPSVCPSDPISLCPANLHLLICPFLFHSSSFCFFNINLS